MKKLFFISAALCFMISPAINAYAHSDSEKTAKISDFEYKEGEENLIVANRNAEKCIALTFDDGPHSEYTMQILDILDKYNAKATFFVIGSNAEKYPDLIKEEVLRGHEIGNHTYSHPDLKKISNEKFHSELMLANETIKNIAGIEPRLFRPPCGYISNSIVNTLSDNEYSVVLWSWRQDTKDWACPGTKQIVSTVLNNIKDGDIILFHDYNANKSQTPQALEIILSRLSESGYKFVTVSELMEM